VLCVRFLLLVTHLLYTLASLSFLPSLISAETITHVRFFLFRFVFTGVSHVFAQFVDVVIVGEFFIISSRFLFCVRVSACVRVKYD